MFNICVVRFDVMRNMKTLQNFSGKQGQNCSEALVKFTNLATL